MVDRPEFEKMCDLLLNGPVAPDGSRIPGYKLLNFNVTFGPDAASMTTEELAGAVTRVLTSDSTAVASFDEIDGPPTSALP